MGEKYQGIKTGSQIKASDMEAALDSKVSLTGNETINGTKTFSIMPVVPHKTAAAANNGTVLATEAQVYLKANASDMTTMLATKENLNNKVTVLSSTSNNTQYPAAKAVYDALAAKANTGDVQVKLPVGTILMYDGTGWRDNVTLVGWYACNKANSDAGRTPNLQDRFIMGSSTRGSVGGNNSVTIKSNNLPNHTHTFTGTNATGDLEAVLGNDVKGKNPSGVFSNTVSNDWNSWTPGSGVKNADTQVRFSMTPAGSVTGGGSNTPTALDNRPNYYTVIYIKRIA